VLADQLAESLGVANKGGEQFLKTQDARETSQGTIDAEAGIVQTPQQKQFQAYRDAQDHVHALASWAVDEQDIAKQVEHQGFEQNPDPKQGLADLNNYLNQTFKDRYAGSSPATSATLAPKMSELRNNANKWFQTQQQQMMDDKQQADLKTITGSAFAKAFVPAVDPTTGQPFTDNNGKQLGGGTFDASKFDYQGINDNNRSLYPGKETNTLTLSNLADLAKTKGVPELLLGMPDRWADGTPTPKGSGDPKVQNQFREDVKQAQEQKDMFLKHAQEANKEAMTLLNRKSESNILDSILSGKNQIPALHAYALQPGADPNFIEKAANWQHERWKQGQEDAIDNGQTATMVSDVAMGKIKTPTDLMDAAQHSGLSGKALTAFMSKGLSTIAETQKVNQDDPEGRAYQDDLNKRYSASINKLTGKFDSPAANQQHADVMLDFARQRANGTDAKSAWANVKTAHGDPIELEDESKGTRNLAPVHDDERAKVIKSGDATAFNASGMTSQDVRRLRDNGQISPEEAAMAAKIIVSRHKK
jgi:hypothetical protein